jgi:transcriptional regulator with XRE-family HTH domain
MAIEFNESEKENKSSLEKSFGKVIMQLRKDLGLSQEELGFRSGYHRTYISQIERGIKSPSLKTIFNLAKALDIKPSDIINRVQCASPRTSVKE